MSLQIYNTLTRKKELFTTLDPKNVRMYVCGPTVYDFAHIGNARPAIVFDVLFRLLRHLAKLGEFDGGKGDTKVTYVRNITDVDDKINARALRDFPGLPLNEAIHKVTETTAKQYSADTLALGCLDPTEQPRATKHIQGMVDMISVLINKGHAYVAGGEVMFDVKSMDDYGKLSNRTIDEQIDGARVEVDEHKKNAGDFVLWKLSSADEPGWDSPWGRGRPGWHIECSVMSKSLLGETFDIHGGGVDLKFPHHENEIAQSRSAHDTKIMAKYWMHNGFLQVEGKKMSKSLGNFVTIQQLLSTDDFGGRPWHGQLLRFVMLQTHYTQPIDWTVDKLKRARLELMSFASRAGDLTAIGRLKAEAKIGTIHEVDEKVLEALSDDLNTPLVITRLREMAVEASAGQEAKMQFIVALKFLGLMSEDTIPYFHDVFVTDTFGMNSAELDLSETIERVRVALANQDFVNLGKLELKMNTAGFQFEEKNGNISVSNLDKTTAEQDSQEIKATIVRLVEDRLVARHQKNWAESDRIRDELASMGIAIKDNKDGTTTWEVKR
jgi:cysteinyl-tRNA synthetase